MKEKTEIFPLRPIFIVFFIFFVTIGVYYPIVYGEFLSTDDFALINSIINVEQINLMQLFFPSGSTTYYRPILYLTFVLDGLIHGGNETYMHIENVILHSLTAVLIFFLTKKIVLLTKINLNIPDKEIYISFFTALFFALHPINTESVCWISARTDLLAGFFVVVAMYNLLIYFHTKNFWRLCLSSISFFMGLLSKESAIGFLVICFIFPFIIMYRKERLKLDNLKFSIPYLILTIIYFLIRHGITFAHSSHSTAYSSTFSSLQVLKWILVSVGFYFKKLFLPVPLNFAIVKVSYIYIPIGIFSLIIIFFSVLQIILNKWLVDKIVSFSIIFMMVFIIPSLPVAVFKIAWTPLAERYLYISSVGVSILVVYLTFKKFPKEIFLVGISLLLLSFGVITYNRAIIWQRNLTLWQDTVEKSPNYAAPRNDYAIALLKEGKILEAKKQLILSKSLAKGDDYVIPEINLAIISMREGNFVDAKKRLDKLLEKEEISSIKKQLIVRKLISITESLLRNNSKSNVRLLLYKDLIFYYNQLVDSKTNGFYQYRMGQIYLAMGDKKNALECFRNAYKLSPNEYFSYAAKKIYRKLKLELTKSKL